MAGLSPFTVMTNILSLAGLGVWAIFGFWVIGFWVIFKKCSSIKYRDFINEWIQKNQLNLLPKFCKLLPKNISKITQKHVGKYNVNFTCPKKSKENFNLFSHAQKWVRK